MHPVHLGMKTLLIFGLRDFSQLKLYLRVKEIYQEKLEDMSNYISSEFSTKPRSLNELDRYKATELKASLLYTGLVCLLENVDEKNIYKSFLSPSVNIHLLSGDGFTRFTESK